MYTLSDDEKKALDFIERMENQQQKRTKIGLATNSKEERPRTRQSYSAKSNLLNVCSKCGKSVGQTEGGFLLNREKNYFELVCPKCFLKY